MDILLIILTIYKHEIGRQNLMATSMLEEADNLFDAGEFERAAGNYELVVPTISQE